mmetsp:Transcript_2192/g.2969  ORF Transcript_2192/g.2969 Transcript_2192/m.2969 type:complete len:416 (+) Transcript_2192:133-1380(+)
MWDVVVVGLGGVGSFALRAVAQIISKGPSRSRSSKMKVLGIERFKPCHSFGSSHGGSRIYRHAYFEDYKYVPLIQYSTAQFQRLQKDMNVKILEECGTLIIEESSKHNDALSIISKCMKSARHHNILVEPLTGGDLKKRFPIFHNLHDMHGLLERHSGFIRPELAIRAALDQAQDLGAIVWDNLNVGYLREVVPVVGRGVKNDPFVEIHLSDGRVVQSKKVIVAMGAWTSKLIKSWSVLKVTRQIQAWVDVRKNSRPDRYHPSQMPTWLISSNQLDVPFYGIPTDPNSPSHACEIKVALHGRDVETDPDSIANERTVNFKERKELEQAFRLFFDDASSLLPFVKAKSCMYTMSPDEHFLIGKPDEYVTDCVYAVAGLSGHGFKMVPSLGKAVADLALHGETELEIDFLSPSRFGI